MSNDAPVVGSIRLYDRALTDLRAGRYRVTSELAVERMGDLPNDPPTTLDAPPAHTLHVTVDAPRWSLAADQIADCHPAPKSRGAFGDQLPHAVLGRRTLPWERPGPFGGPWLALLVVADGEGTFAEGKVHDLLAPAVVTALEASEPIDGNPSVAVLRLASIELQRALLPTLDETEWLSHVRQVNVQDSAMAGTDDDGWFAVVAGNRLPQGAADGVNYTACIVSLEARADLWALSTTAPVPIIVLRAWPFISTADGGTFEALGHALDAQPFGAVASAATAAGTTATSEVVRRDRQGDAQPARYRGPLLGAFATPLDSYEGEISGECAAELGRLLGSADGRFLREVVGWHRAAEAGARSSFNAQRLSALLATGSDTSPRARGARSTATSADTGAAPVTSASVGLAMSDLIAGHVSRNVPRAALWQRPALLDEDRS
jgi:hypothetical protein